MSEIAGKMVLEYAQAGVVLREQFFKENADRVVETGKAMAVCLARGGKILFCGNGGSAADAQHLSAELVNRFLMERPPLPSIALSTDTSALTAIGNDYGFDQVFSKQVQALGENGDLLVGISTSGNSENVILALQAAKDKGMVTVGLTGGTGGDMAQYCDFQLHVPSSDTPLIQEVQAATGHMLCRLVDYFLFESVLDIQPYLE